MNQHSFVNGCLKWYQENGIIPGDPNEGTWHDCHYPVPECLGGSDTILLLEQHHAIQGVLQSEEFQHCCVWTWEKKFLTGNLLDLYNKWRLWCQSLAVEGSVQKKDERGKSVVQVKAGTASMRKRNLIKDEEGRSVSAVKAAQAAHEKKDEHGNSLTAVKAGKAMAKVIHADVNDKGQSMFALKIFSQRWRCLTTGYESNASGVARYQKMRGLLPLREKVTITVEC